MPLNIWKFQSESTIAVFQEMTEEQDKADQLKKKRAG